MTRAVLGALLSLGFGVAGAAPRRAHAQQATAPGASDDVSALPLHVIASRSASPIALAVMLSGDGGWASIDRRIADDLASNGVAVVGMDSRRYLMHARTPDEAAADVARVIRRFGARWAVQRVAIIGYSRGADLAPFVTNRLPDALRHEIALVALLGPAERANFEFHWIDLLSDKSRPSDAPILPELERLRGTPVLCVFSADEKESVCRLADTSAVHVDRRPGKHHFDGAYDAIAAAILHLLAPMDAGER